MLAVEGGCWFPVQLLNLTAGEDTTGVFVTHQLLFVFSFQWNHRSTIPPHPDSHVCHLKKQSVDGQSVFG